MKLEEKRKLFRKVGILPLSEVKERRGRDYLYVIHKDNKYRVEGYVTRDKADLESDWRLKGWDPKLERYYLRSDGNGLYSLLRLIHPRKKYPKERWKHLDYWLWCLMTGDEEETRLIDAPKEVLRDLAQAGASPEKVAEAAKLIKEMKHDWRAMEKLEKLFRPYASHQAMLRSSTSGDWYERYSEKLGV